MVSLFHGEFHSFFIRFHTIWNPMKPFRNRIIIIYPIHQKRGILCGCLVLILNERVAGFEGCGRADAAKTVRWTVISTPGWRWGRPRPRRESRHSDHQKRGIPWGCLVFLILNERVTGFDRNLSFSTIFALWQGDACGRLEWILDPWNAGKKVDSLMGKA